MDESENAVYRITVNADIEHNDDNKISTSKYTWYNCIPKILLEQFSKMANIYFLLIAIMQVIIDYYSSLFLKSLYLEEIPSSYYHCLLLFSSMV